jgi:hypothetical protein
VEEAFVNVLGVEGGIHAIRLESAGALKLTDPALSADLERALAILRIQTAGSGERQIYPRALLIDSFTYSTDAK